MTLAFCPVAPSDRDLLHRPYPLMEDSWTNHVYQMCQRGQQLKPTRETPALCYSRHLLLQPFSSPIFSCSGVHVLSDNDCPWCPPKKTDIDTPP